MKGWVRIALLCPWVVLASENSFELFHLANQAFDKGEYESAIQHYRSLIAEGYESADLHHNLANSYFRAGKVGYALFHYRRASDYSPRDPDIQFNLNYAREKVTDQIENREAIWDRMRTLLAAVSAKEAMGCFVALSSLLLLASCLMLYRKWEWLRWVRLSMFGFWGWSVVALAYHLWLREAPGVIIAAEAKVYSGIGKQNVVLFLLHEGVELSIVDSSQLPWVRIRLADGKQGWLPSENLTFEKGL